VLVLSQLSKISTLREVTMWLKMILLGNAKEAILCISSWWSELLLLVGETILFSSGHLSSIWRILEKVHVLNPRPHSRWCHALKHSCFCSGYIGLGKLALEASPQARYHLKRTWIDHLLSVRWRSFGMPVVKHKAGSSGLPTPLPGYQSRKFSLELQCSCFGSGRGARVLELGQTAP
jgi:hypothetical protein